MAARIVNGRHIAPGVSLDVNPTSRAMLEDLMRDGHIASLLRAGARLHQAGCNGCIGMGQAPATGRNSLRTVPRNFPGRSGTREDSVWLCSPETAAASALGGAISDPRELDMDYPRIRPPEHPTVDPESMEEPPPREEAQQTRLVKGPNIHSLPEMQPLPDSLDVPVLLRVKDDISTDEIMPAGTRVLPFRSNIPKIAEFCFDIVDDSYARRALEVKDAGGHAIVAGDNYGQGSSREHAALAPRYLGLRLVLAKSFARIHWQNLVDFGVLPLEFDNADDYDRIKPGERLRTRGLRAALDRDEHIELELAGGGRVPAHHQLSPRQVRVILAGSLIHEWRNRRG